MQPERKSKEKGKKHWLRRMLVAAVVLMLLLAAAAVASIFGIEYLIDIWWFDALGHSFYFWQRVLYRYAVFGIVGVFFFIVFFLNFWLAARFLKTGDIEGLDSRNKKAKGIIRGIQAGSVWFYGPVSLALSITLALPLFQQWEGFLFYIFGRDMGTADPFLGKDVAFYLFAYPIYSLLQQRLILSVLLLGIVLAIFYTAKNHLLQRKWFQYGRGARWHLSLITAGLCFLGIWGFMLQRYDLVYDMSHQGLFDGPGYVQMNVVLPLIWLCMGALAAVAPALVVVIQWGKGFKTCLALVLVFALSLALRQFDFLPQIVQTYIVNPNEPEKEGPYIAKHIQATLDAYRLNDIDVRDFDYERFPQKRDDSRVDDVLRNIPVWDAETLAAVFQQLQELRTYYMFPRVSVDRYTIGDRHQQVFLSPREIEFANLPGGARNWINEHLTYTHGFGAVMTPASQVSGQTITWYLHNIPPESQFGLTIEQPRIYYGLGSYNYSIVPNRAGEMDYPKGNSNAVHHYSGKGGVPVSSLFRKFLFAYHLGNKNLFFSTKITQQSKLLIRRNIIERIEFLVPFLKLDETPYVVITPEGIHWIVDAYTTSRYYPAAASSGQNGEAFNYMRNSVKIVVDAYHGSVDLYVFDEKDPIVQAYDRIYPGLFKDKDKMPAALKPHVRYPKDIFDIQMRVYAKYHQKDPQVFYQQEDLWTFAGQPRENNAVPKKPYYVTLDLFKSRQMDFLLIVPMLPKNRDNLRAVAVAGCDPDNYGELVVYNFPKGELVYGPAQIDALINQDPDVAEQFTLWDQAGSQIIRGKMVILPVGSSILFIQPVYLKATSRVKIPELQRIIMSEGETVVMEQSVQAAYAELKRRIPRDVAEDQPLPQETTEPSSPADGNVSETERTPQKKNLQSSTPTAEKTAPPVPPPNNNRDTGKRP
jgi:uncharacterized membrane protein (UPF0182 family)